MFKRSLLIFILTQFIAYPLYAGTVSFSQLAVSSDLTTTKYNSDLDTIYQKVNANVQTDNVLNDTLTEADMADEINPRIRTAEGASCQFVYTGLLPGTTSGTLTGSVPAGTAYPLGYRVVKSSSTAKTWTASKWTFVDLDINGNFTYSEVAIGGSTPSVAPNSIRLARVSTDTAQANSVQDLRTTSCAAGPFDVISDAASEATLDDVLSTGRPVRNTAMGQTTPNGWIQGLHVSWDSATTFRVTAGSAYINGKFRRTSVDIVVPQTADDPANAVSGIDSGAIGSSTSYDIYAVADQDGSKDLSVTYSTNTTAPAAVTNSRKIGHIATNASSSFISRDLLTLNAINGSETVGGWVHFNGTGTPTPNAGFNVSGIGDNGTGDYTIHWDWNAASGDNAVAVFAKEGPGLNVSATCSIKDVVNPQTAGAIHIQCRTQAAGALDPPEVSVIMFGDMKNVK